jgi:uncharacterized protein
MKTPALFAVPILLAILPVTGGASLLWRTQQQDPKAAPVSGAPTSALGIDPTKEADIRKLLEVVGTRQLANQTMQSTLGTMKPLLMNALPPGEYREKLVELFFAKFQSKYGDQQIVDLAVPVYDKYFSDEEIKELTKFYATPLGKKTIVALPKVVADLQSAGAKSGQEAGRQSMEEVLAEHPDLAKAMEEAKQKQ